MLSVLTAEMLLKMRSSVSFLRKLFIGIGRDEGIDVLLKLCETSECVEDVGLYYNSLSTSKDVALDLSMRLLNSTRKQCHLKKVRITICFSNDEEKNKFEVAIDNAVQVFRFRHIDVRVDAIVLWGRVPDFGFSLLH